MLMFTPAISCLTTFNLSWFMHLTFQVPLSMGFSRKESYSGLLPFLTVVSLCLYIPGVLGVHWKGWSWNSNTLATSCDELTHWERLWCWEGLGAGEEGDDRGWDGWMASLTRWTWVWVDSGSWWWTGRPGVLWFMGSQRVRHDWVTLLNCTDI